VIYNQDERVNFIKKPNENNNTLSYNPKIKFGELATKKMSEI
jgi:hypothetical protein